MTDAAPLTLRSLVLLRVLAPGAKLNAGRIHADVAALCSPPPPGARIDEEIAEVRVAGLMELKKFALTEAGRAEALALLGLAKPPPRLTWDAVCKKHLLPSAMGMTREAFERQKLDKADKLQALVLKRRYSLPLGPAPSLNEALEALACHLLGHGDCAALGQLMRKVVSRAAGSEEPFEAKAFAKLAPRLLIDFKPGAGGLQKMLLAGAFRAADSAGTAGLDGFARAVRDAARRAEGGRFGANKLFIGHLWRALRADPAFAGLALGDFKARLVEASRAGLLTLSRADLADELDPADVEESETPYLNATFHFLLTEGAA